MKQASIDHLTSLISYGNQNDKTNPVVLTRIFNKLNEGDIRRLEEAVRGRLEVERRLASKAFLDKVSVKDLRETRRFTPVTLADGSRVHYRTDYYLGFQHLGSVQRRQKEDKFYTLTVAHYSEKEGRDLNWLCEANGLELSE